MRVWLKYRAGSHLPRRMRHPLPTKRPKRSESWNTVGPYIPYDLLQTKGETSAKFNGDRFRNVDFYRVQTQEVDKKEQKAISALYIRRFYTTQRGCLTQKIFTQFQLPYYYWHVFCFYCPHLTYKDGCLYVCKFVPYTNAHF